MSAHITTEDRKAIYYYRTLGWKQKAIAHILTRHPSVISREIKRNSGLDGVYRPGEATARYIERRLRAKNRYQKITHNYVLQHYIARGLRASLSPEQIAGRLAFHTAETVVCHETIYQWIYKHRPNYIPQLCYKKNKYRRKRGTKAREKKRRSMQCRSIDDRPAVVEERIRCGDFEGDTIIGGNKKHRILTHVDRASGYGVADLLLNVSSEVIQQKIIARFKAVPHKKRHTITYDNGPEFGGDDTLVERYAHVTVYRAHPYHSWERGTNENYNGLLRRYFPKGTQFDTLTQKDVDRVVHRINHRPRKRLGYLTPHEVFVLGIKPNCISR